MQAARWRSSRGVEDDDFWEHDGTEQILKLVSSVVLRRGRWCFEFVLVPRGKVFVDGSGFDAIAMNRLSATDETANGRVDEIRKILKSEVYKRERNLRKNRKKEVDSG